MFDFSVKAFVSVDFLATRTCENLKWIKMFDALPNEEKARSGYLEFPIWN